jgi:catechol 2,3-dioxygenase-like lactoylglutathione lyase family enzyme
MIDHTGVSVSDMAKSKKFYTEALKPIGYVLKSDYGEAVGFGEDHPDFWLGIGSGSHVHVAFRVKSKEMVDAFHKAGLAAGGTDNGAPGIRAQYHPTYYAAFVKDPDGNNIEAVFHG